MVREKTSIYWFNWPAHVGGSDTKFVHTLRLLAGEYDITVIPNDAGYYADPLWLDFLAGLGVKTALMEELPEQLDGWAISLCNGIFIKNGMLGDCLRRGLRVIWSSEMMWHFYGELEAVRFGLIHRVLYVSPAQRRILEPGYQWALSGAARQPAVAAASLIDEDAWHGTLSGSAGGSLEWIMSGNYIDPSQFPFRVRGPKMPGDPFTIGRISRPDPDKFPDDFPLSYERLGLREPVRYRVLGWSDQLAARWPEHFYDEHWDLVPTAGEPVPAFLDSLDILVYDLSPRFKESWGRAVVEAMLSGVVPLVPRGGGHHLEHLVPHEIGGFLCDGPEDFSRYTCALQDDPVLLARLSHGARTWASEHLCKASDHLAVWRQVFAD